MTAKQMIIARIEESVRDLTENLNHAREIEFASWQIQQSLLDFATEIAEIGPAIDDLEKSDDLQYALKNLTLDLSAPDLEKFVIKCEQAIEVSESLLKAKKSIDSL